MSLCDHSIRRAKDSPYQQHPPGMRSGLSISLVTRNPFMVSVHGGRSTGGCGQGASIETVRWSGTAAAYSLRGTLAFSITTSILAMPFPYVCRLPVLITNGSLS